MDFIYRARRHQRNSEPPAALEEIAFSNSLYAIMPRLNSLRTRLTLNRGEIDEAMRHLHAQGEIAQITQMLFQNEIPLLTADRVSTSPPAAERALVRVR